LVVNVKLVAPRIGVKLRLSVELDHWIVPGLPSKNKNAVPPIQTETLDVCEINAVGSPTSIPSRLEMTFGELETIRIR
jgi:hypothetical protein